MSRDTAHIVRFGIVLLAMTVLSIIVWQFVGDRLYDCTDDNMVGFLRPGNWVHSVGNQPVVVVPVIVHNRSMSEPDTIKAGWSIGRLWCLWFLFLLVSLGFSVLLARKTWGQNQGAPNN